MNVTFWRHSFVDVVSAELACESLDTLACFWLGCDDDYIVLIECTGLIASHIDYLALFSFTAQVALK